MLLLSQLQFILLAVTFIVSFPRLTLPFPVGLPMPQQWEGSRIKQREPQHSRQMLTGAQETPTERSQRSNTKVLAISTSSSSDYKLRNERNSTNGEQNKTAAENRHTLHGLRSQRSPNMVAGFSLMQSSIDRIRCVFERFGAMILLRTDHSQPNSYDRNKMLRRSNHDFISRFIFSHDKEKDRRVKSIFASNGSSLNSAIHHADMQDSMLSQPETSQSFGLLDPESIFPVSKGRQNFVKYSPPTVSLPSTSGIGPALSVSKYLKTTGAKYIAAAPCARTRFWFPTVLRTLEKEGFRLVFYCIDTGVSELDSQETRAAFSGLSSIKLGGFISTDLNDIEDLLPRNLDVVISWFGIRSWGVRNGLRFVKALQRSGVKRAVFTRMCSNPGDEIDEPWAESDSRATTFWANKAKRRRKRYLKGCSRMVVYSLN